MSFIPGMQAWFSIWKKKQNNVIYPHKKNSKSNKWVQQSQGFIINIQKLIIFLYISTDHVDSEKCNTIYNC